MLRCCVNANRAAANWAWFHEQRPPRIRIGVSVRGAVRTRQTVSSAFFPLMGQPGPREEQITGARQKQMTHDRGIPPDLEAIHPQVPLGVL